MRSPDPSTAFPTPLTAYPSSADASLADTLRDRVVFEPFNVAATAASAAVVSAAVPRVAFVAVVVLLAGWCGGSGRLDALDDSRLTAAWR